MNYLKIQMLCLMASLCLAQGTVQAIKQANDTCPERDECHKEIYEAYKKWWEIRNDESPMENHFHNESEKAIKKCTNTFGTTWLWTDLPTKRDCLRGARQVAGNLGDDVIVKAITTKIAKDQGGIFSDPRVTILVAAVTSYAAHTFFLPNLSLGLLKCGYGKQK